MTDETRRPDPDPTALTTHALEREVRALKDQIEDKVEALQEALNDKVVGRHIEQTAIKEEFEAKINALREIMAVRFKAVEDRFAEVERGRVEQKQDTQSAVQAALVSQKEANDKTEVSFRTQNAATDSKVDALTERVIGLEKLKQGGQEAKASLYAFAGFVAALMLIGGAVLAFGR